MKRWSKIVSIITIMIYLNTSAQVDPCLIINGQINPVGKAVQVCDPNPPAPQAPQFNIITNNCASPAGSATYIRYTVVYDPASTKDTLLKKSNSGSFSDTRAGWFKVIMYYDDGSTVVNDADSVNISFFTKPPVITTPGTPFSKCPSDVLNVNVSNNTLASYRWYKNTAPSTTLSTGTSMVFNIANTITSPANNSYTVEATDVNGCKTSANFSVVATTAPLLNLGSDITRCLNNTTSFTISNSSHLSNSGLNANPSYLWKGGSSTLSGGVFTPVLSNLNSATAQVNDMSITFKNSPATATPQDEFALPTSDYYIVVYAENVLFCKTYDTIKIDIVETPTPVCSNDTLICYGGTAALSSTISGGLPPYTYSWNNGAGSASTASVSPTSTTTYTLTLTDGSGCGFTPQVDNVTVTVNPQLTASAGADQLICFEPVQTANLNASATGGTAGYNYAWTPTATLSSASINNPVASPTTSTTYTVTITDANNCTATDNILVNVYKPDIGNIPYPVVVSEGKPYTFDVSTSQNSGYNFVWTNLSTTNTSNGPSFEAKYAGQDTIEYEIRVTDPTYNCIARDTAIVWYISDNTILYVPNIFSPSAELETNRRLRVYGDNLSDDGFRFAIFNKWGQTVWETTNVAEAKDGWDGGPQIEGVYTYIVEGKFKNDKPVTESKEYMGTFKLSK